MKMYGISNCDTVKKARAWLEAHGVDYEFHDYKKHGVDAVLMQKWLAQVGWEKLVNRQGQTWRKLTDAEKAGIKNNAAALQLMLDKPSLIKRPAIEIKDQLILGYNPSDYEFIFGEK
jgi:arsenate reductase